MMYGFLRTRPSVGALVGLDQRNQWGVPSADSKYSLYVLVLDKALHVDIC